MRIGEAKTTKTGRAVCAAALALALAGAPAAAAADGPDNENLRGGGALN